MERFQPANGTSAATVPQHRRTCWPTSLPRVGVSLLKTSSGARDPFGMSANGSVSRVSPVHTAMRNCTRDEGGPFEVGNQVLISSHRRLLSSKAIVVSVAETAGQDPVRQG